MREPLKGAEGDELADMRRKARELLRSLRGVEAESVSGIGRTPHGWKVTLEVVEMRRSPSPPTSSPATRSSSTVTASWPSSAAAATTARRLGVSAGEQPRARAPGRPPAPAQLADVLERVLDKGIVIAGDIQINLLDIELLTVRLRLLVASADKAREMGIDWWEGDPFLSNGGRTETATASTCGCGPWRRRPGFRGRTRRRRLVIGRPGHGLVRLRRRRGPGGAPAARRGRADPPTGL